MLERMEAQRIADGFVGDDEPVFRHEYVHRDAKSRYPSSYIATNDVTHLPGRLLTTITVSIASVNHARPRHS
jgi:hypothetical protein